MKVKMKERKKDRKKERKTERQKERKKERQTDEGLNVFIVSHSCDEGSDCHRSIIIKTGSATVLLKIVSGNLRVEDKVNSYSLPATVQNMEIDEVKEMVPIG